jgi:uncharacterized protein (DUF2062 family)
MENAVFAIVCEKYKRFLAKTRDSTINRCMGDINREKESRFKRIRFVKKFLRHVPRRASIHRYPVINKFANIARKRPYLWSFRVSEIIPAFYLGWIITLTPLPSVVQIIIAFGAALLCRANVMVLTSLQLISNMLTFPFLWAITHKVGATIVTFLGTENLSVTPAAHEYSSIAKYGERAIRAVATITLGAIVLGSILGAISGFVYKYFAKKYSSHGNSVKNSGKI